jgi:RND family efflux transporter MFP subunit
LPRLYNPGDLRSQSLIVLPDRLSEDLASLKIDRGAKPRNRSARVLVVVIVILCLVAAATAFGYSKVKSTLLNTEVSVGEISLVSPAQAQVQLTATGYVVALVYAKVASKVPGRIAELFVDEGDHVEKGQKVARLEDVDFKTALATSRAHAAAARARIAVARASLAEIRVQIERETPLVEKGVSARATLEDLKTRSDSAVAAVRAAEAEAAASDAETRALEVQLGSYEIITPISGTVVDKLVKVGEGVSPGFGTPGVIEVIDMTSLVVEVDVPEARLSQVEVDGPCEIVLDSNPSKRYRGAVKEIGRRVNRSKATVPVKIRFVFADDDPPAATPSAPAGGAASAPAGATKKPGVDILPDMAARVSFLSKALDPKSLDVPPKLIVPTAAVTKRGAADVVFVVDEGEVRMTTVKVGPAFADGLELETKLPVGTKVVLGPPSNLTDGQQVKEIKH